MANIIKDVVITEEHPKSLMLDKHKNFIAGYGANKDEYEYCMTEYLRMSGMYWGVASLALIDKLDHLNRTELIEYIKECQCMETGGFSASQKHDPHILYTLSAIQILTMYEALAEVDLDGVVRYVCSLQQQDGSFTGDKWGEVDTRFSFCAVACLSLINRLNEINLNSAVKFVVSCMNFDGGFGSRPGSESHAGLIYCCVGFLSITQQLHHIDGDLLGWWLCERQLEGSGGLNGRPEKLPDVCYSWWVVASLTMLGRQHWIDGKKLKNFVLACQDTETGGFSDRPGDLPDPFHTLFGLAALSLLEDENILPVNPTYCMPECTLGGLSVKPQKLTIDI